MGWAVSTTQGEVTNVGTASLLLCLLVVQCMKGSGTITRNMAEVGIYPRVVR